MKISYLLFISLLSVVFSACQSQEGSHQKPYIMGMERKAGVNPNSLAYVVEEKANDRKNLLELKKLETEANVEMTKIKSQKDLDIAKIQSQTQKEIAHVNVEVKKEDSKKTFYIAIAFVAVLVLALLLWYLNARRNRELKIRLEKQRHEHELALKAKEIEQQKMDRLLELMANGRLPKEAKSQIVTALVSSETQVIEHKEIED